MASPPRRYPHVPSIGYQFAAIKRIDPAGKKRDEFAAWRWINVDSPTSRLVTLNAASGEAVSASSWWLQEPGTYTR